MRTVNRLLPTLSWTGTWGATKASVWHLQRKATETTETPEQGMPSMLRRPPELPVLEKVGQYGNLPLRRPPAGRSAGGMFSPLVQTYVQAPSVAGL